MSLIRRPIFLAILAIAGGDAMAQTPATGTESQPASSAQDGMALPTVTVTSRRVNERAQDVPLSINVLSYKDLSDRGVTSLSELAQYTPGLSYSPDLGRVGERPVVRGISTNIPSSPQPVSVFVDGVYIRQGVLGLLLDDAERVEVIKGPQSALYGRSTYAGAINYVTVKPSQDISGTVSVTGAQAGESSAFAAVSFPVLKDVLSARVKVKHYEFGGQYTNVLTGNKIGDERSNMAGIQLQFKPSKSFDALFSIDSSADRDGLFAAQTRTIPVQVGGKVTNQNGSSNVANGTVCNGRTINLVGNNAVTGLPDASVPAALTTLVNGWPCGPSTFTGTSVRLNEADFANFVDPKTGINYGNIAGLDRKINRGALTMNFRFDNGYTLTSQTAVSHEQLNNGVDQSYAGVRFAPAFLGGSSWTSYDRDKLNYTSQELRLSSPSDAPLTWLIGGFVYKEDTNGITSGVIAQNAAGQVINDPMRDKSATSVYNVAPFGRIQYEIDKTKRVSFEGRYSSEKIEVAGTPLGIAKVTAGTCIAGQVCSVSGSQTFKDFAPRVTFDYKPSANLMYYAQVAKGSKSGGFNTTAGLPAANFTYDGETIKSFEAGIKSQVFDRRLGLNLALFRNDVDGLQLSNLAPYTNPITGASTTTTMVNNVGKARTQGIELDVSFKATKWLTLSGNYAYTDAKGLAGTDNTNGTIFGGDRSVAGFILPRSPKHSAAGAAAVDFPVGGSGLNFFARADVTYQSLRYSGIDNLVWADPFTRINLSAGLRGKGWRGSVWVKNAADNDASLNGFRYVDAATFRRTATDFLSRLRQAGVTASYDF